MRIAKIDFLCPWVGAYETALPDLPVIALLGRSNVGKSSLINRLTQRKKIARASRTPGRTAEIVCFLVEAALDTGKPFKFILADFPGFGYAKRSEQQTRAMSRLIERGLQELPRLTVGCILNDCRRAPEEEELWVRQELYERGAHCKVVLTKCDKLGNEALKAERKAIAAAYQLQPEDLELSGSNTPVKFLWDRLLPLVI